MVGPADSVKLILDAAVENGLADEVLTRVYSDLSDADRLVEELDPLCHVILLTGLVPYRLATSGKQHRATLDYVPHSGIDLYRALARILLQSQGHVPRLSIDTIESSLIEEVLLDLDLNIAVKTLDLGEIDGVNAVQRITDFHQECYRSGEVEACVTCVGSVYEALTLRGLPAWRVEHTRIAMREALRRASLMARIAKSEDAQHAVVAVEMEGLSVASAAASYDAQRLRLRVREAMINYAERLHGRILDSDSNRFLIGTTRASVESWSRRSRPRLWDLPRDIPLPAYVGVGVADTVTKAEEHALHALRLHRQTGQPHLISPTASIARLDRKSSGPAQQLLSKRQTEIGSLLGVGSGTVQRLLDALLRIETSGFTAKDLAAAYGFEVRSARRLLTQLARAGLVTPLGRRSIGTGRPSTVYTTTPALLQSMGSDRAELRHPELG